MEIVLICSYINPNIIYLIYAKVMWWNIIRFIQDLTQKVLL